jgi:hypothetical protein
LIIIPINSWSWRVMVIRIVVDLGELVEVALKKGGARKGVGGWVKRYWVC